MYAKSMIFIDFCKDCRKRPAFRCTIIHIDLLVFFCDRNVAVFLLGATIHGLAGTHTLTTVNWRLWHTRNWEMTPFSESLSTVHLLSATMTSAVNTTYSLEEANALNPLLLLALCLFRTMVVQVCGNQFPLKWAGFAMPRLKANCYLEIFKFQFMSNNLVEVVIHSLARSIVVGWQTIYWLKNTACENSVPINCRLLWSWLSSTILLPLWYAFSQCFFFLGNCNG